MVKASYLSKSSSLLKPYWVILDRRAGTSERLPASSQVLILAVSFASMSPWKNRGERVWIKISTGCQPSSGKTAKQNKTQRIVAQGKRQMKKRRKRRARTHPRDGSLSVSNPTRVLDTFSGYHWKEKWKRLERWRAIKTQTKRRHRHKIVINK